MTIHARVNMGISQHTIMANDENANMKKEIICGTKGQ